MARRIRVGSRGSELALIQARAIIEALETETELVLIETSGDRFTDRPLSRIGSAGVFIKEIEAALLEDRIDLAVHSMKDVPSAVANGLVLAATTRRADPRDALVSRTADTIDALPQGAHIATGSLRRRSQLLAMRPDLVIEDLRGNVPTRLAKLDASSWDAVILAAAGLERLGLGERIKIRIPTEVMIPAVGQGALAVEIRGEDPGLREAVSKLNHFESERAVAAERAFLGRLEGGCQVPVGAYAEVDGAELRVRGFVGSVDGKRALRREASGSIDAAERVGLELAEAMLQEGAAEIIREVAEVE